MLLVLAPGDDVVDGIRPRAPNQEVVAIAQAHVLMLKRRRAQPCGCDK
jgi:hypothetical protein